MSSSHQITLQICTDCLREMTDQSKTVPLMRRSHRWSFWCEHAITEDWHPGHASPLGMRIGPL